MINRRNFLGAGVGLGLGTGNDGSGNGPSRSARGDQDQYEQTLAETDRLELVGIPRSWAAVRQGFLPLSPERVVIIKAEERQWHDDPGDRWGCSYVDRVVRDRIAKRIAEEERNWVPAKVTPEKLSLIVRMTRYLTDYYGMPARFEAWADLISRRELLGSTGMPHHAGILDWIQRPGAKTQNAHVDWWVFLFPEGLPCWESILGESTHILGLPIFTRSADQVLGYRMDVLRLVQNTFLRLGREFDPIAVSQMDRVRACRVVNRCAAACLGNPNME